MNKEQLVKAIATKTNVSQKEAGHILDALTETIMETVAEGNRITLVGFGSFESRQRQERLGRNPQTGKPITIPATKVPAFAAGKLFKEKITPPPAKESKPKSSKAKSKGKPK